MNFNIKKSSHIFSLLLLIFAFLVLFVFPILSFLEVGIFASIESTQITKMSNNIRLIFEIIALLFQILFIVFGLFIGIPFIWYFLVNKISLKEIYARLNLRFEEIDIAILWAIIAVVTGFMMTVAVGFLLSQFGFDVTDTSNIPDLEKIFSLPSIFILVLLQPVGEEIFFRGFLLDKITYIGGKRIAIIATAMLFGIAHLSYGMVYTAAMAGMLGVIFACIVIKTKNLYSSIFAHIMFNVISLTFYIFAQSLNF